MCNVMPVPMVIFRILSSYLETHDKEFCSQAIWQRQRHGKYGHPAPEQSNRVGKMKTGGQISSQRMNCSMKALEDWGSPPQDR